MYVSQCFISCLAYISVTAVKVQDVVSFALYVHIENFLYKCNIVLFADVVKGEKKKRCGKEKKKLMTVCIQDLFSNKEILMTRTWFR